MPLKVTEPLLAQRLQPHSEATFVRGYPKLYISQTWDYASLHAVVDFF